MSVQERQQLWGGETDKAVAAITNVTAILQAFHADERAFYQAIINHDSSWRRRGTVLPA